MTIAEHETRPQEPEPFKTCARCSGDLTGKQSFRGAICNADGYAIFRVCAGCRKILLQSRTAQQQFTADGCQKISLALNSAAGSA